MKIVLLAEVSASSVIGGAERVLREQALGLSRRGHQVEVVARAPDGDARPTMAVEAAREHRYAVSDRHELAFVLTSFRQSLRAFDRACGAAGCEVAVIHQSLAGLGAVLRRRSRAAGWVYVCHSLAHEEYLSRTAGAGTALQRLRRRLNARVRLWAERLVIGRCDRVVVLSEFMRRRIAAVHRVPEPRIHVIPGAADLSRFRPPADRDAVRHALKLPLNKTVMVTVRNLVPRMGLEQLVSAVECLGEIGRSCLVLIGGEGPLRPSIERQVRERGLTDRIILLGFVPEEELPQYYQAADLVLMPTYELEGFGLVTVEALACGTPVLGTPVGAIPEVLARLDPALIAEGNDGPSLAMAIQRVLGRFRTHPDERMRLAERGRALVEHAYTWDRHIGALEDVLQRARG